MWRPPSVTLAYINHIFQRFAFLIPLENVLSECMRVIQPGGVLLITEYAPLPSKHLLYRIPASRWLICRLEPFLDGFWRDDIASMLNLYGKAHGKNAVTESDQRIFSEFYRVTEFRVADIGP